MLFFFVAVLAGIFTVLAPCILPLLPVVIGASEEGTRYVSRRALVVIGSLSLSVILFTLLLKASTALIGIPQSFWNAFSGIIIILVGLAIVFPDAWSKIPLVQRLSRLGNQAVGTGFKQKSYKGDLLIGLALGPVFTTCSPTYLFIVATALPAGFAVGFVYLLGYTLGLAASLLLIAVFGQQVVNKITSRMQTAGKIKQVFGALIMLVGIGVVTGYDKKLEAFILNSGYGATIKVEEGLLDRFAPKEKMPAHKDAMAHESQETITLAGGCFWCIEAVFQEENGVIDAVSGYAGGDEASASYLLVSTGTTGHRESVQVTYDPTVVSTEKILDLFWSHIDPTQADGQFADKGFQYTTAIFYNSEEQEMVARDSKERLQKSGLFKKDVATSIIPFTTFFPAEEYHQDYYKKSALHYELYKRASGRAGFVEDTWARDAAIEFLQSEQAKAAE